MIIKKHFSQNLNAEQWSTMATGGGSLITTSGVVRVVFFGTFTEFGNYDYWRFSRPSGIKK